MNDWQETACIWTCRTATTWQLRKTWEAFHELSNFQLHSGAFAATVAPVAMAIDFFVYERLCRLCRSWLCREGGRAKPRDACGPQGARKWRTEEVLVYTWEQYKNKNLWESYAEEVVNFWQYAKSKGRPSRGSFWSIFACTSNHSLLCHILCHIMSGRVTSYHGRDQHLHIYDLPHRCIFYFLVDTFPITFVMYSVRVFWFYIHRFFILQIIDSGDVGYLFLHISSCTATCRPSE